MTSPPRLLNFLLVVQLFFIGAGTMITRVHVRMYDKFGYADDEPSRWIPDHSLSFVARCVDTLGLWLFVVPAIWFFIAVGRQRDKNRRQELTVGQLRICMGVTAGVMLLFSYSSLNAIRSVFW